MKKIITKGFKETQKLGKNFAQEILSCEQFNITKKSRLRDLCNKKKAIVLCLYGDLGGGKTTFLQGFAKGLGIKQKVLSPTFVIMKKFPIFLNHAAKTFGNVSFKNFYHIDAYRLQNEKDFKELSLSGIIKNPENIVCIEWPERIKKILPKDTGKIKFKFVSENKREITI